jgi:hypothetical protein
MSYAAGLLRRIRSSRQRAPIYYYRCVPEIMLIILGLQHDKKYQISKSKYQSEDGNLFIGSREVIDVFAIPVRGAVLSNVPGLVIDFESTGFLHLKFGF